MSSREEIEKITKQKAETFDKVFSTPDGQKILDYLAEEFIPDDMRSQSVENTYFNLGRRDVIVYIDQMIRYANKGEQ